MAFQGCSAGALQDIFLPYKEKLRSSVGILIGRRGVRMRFSEACCTRLYTPPSTRAGALDLTEKRMSIRSLVARFSRTMERSGEISRRSIGIDLFLFLPCFFFPWGVGRSHGTPYAGRGSLSSPGIDPRIQFLLESRYRGGCHF